ncbi:hypothetical protein BH18ACT4_BH18ACT4_01880 [soil metagenome]
MLAVVEERFSDLDRCVHEAAATSSDAFERLRRAGEAYLDFGRGHRGHYRVLFGPISGSALRPGSDRDHPGKAAFSTLVVMVQACIDAAQADADAFVVAVERWAFLHGLVDLHAVCPRFPFPPQAVLAGAWVDRLRVSLESPGDPEPPAG